MKAINVIEKHKLFIKQWYPHIIAEGCSLQVYLSKIQGDFVMHSHDNGDEIFFVLKGEMEMIFKDRIEPVREGELILVPKGVVHSPRTKPDEEVHLLMIEHLGTTHTGDVQHERTIKNFESI